MALTVRATVRNTGERTGDEVAQCYLRLDGRSVRTPRWQLVGFQKVRLAPGQSAEVVFAVPPRLLSVVRHDGSRVVEPGAVTIAVGGCSPGDRGRALGAPALAEARATI